MKKQGTIFLILVSLGLLFAGSVSAQDPSVDVTRFSILRDSLLTQYKPGDNVTLEATVNSGTDGINTPILYLYNFPDDMTV